MTPACGRTASELHWRDDPTDSWRRHAVASIGAQATGAIASATAEAGRKLDNVKNGVDAKDAVRLATPTTDSADRSNRRLSGSVKADVGTALRY